MAHGVRRMPKEWPRSDRCQSIPACSRPTESIEVFWIRTEIHAGSPQNSNQPSLLGTLVCGGYLVLSGKLPLDGAAHQVRRACSAAMGSLFQPSAQVSGK